MKSAKYIFVLVLLPMAGLFLLFTLLDKIDAAQKYQEAEPLVEIVWPLADQMREFHDTHGEHARSLDQLSAEQKVLALSGYKPKFTPTGSNIFSMTVNDRFGFCITQEFQPMWVTKP